MPLLWPFWHVGHEPKGLMKAKDARSLSCHWNKHVGVIQMWIFGDFFQQVFSNFNSHHGVMNDVLRSCMSGVPFLTPFAAQPMCGQLIHFITTTFSHWYMYMYIYSYVAQVGTHRRNEESPVTGHFNWDEHTLADIITVVVNQMHIHDLCLRNIQESRWIRTLGTLYPSAIKPGVNSLWNLSDDHLHRPEASCALFWQQDYWIFIIPRTNNLCMTNDFKYKVLTIYHVRSTQIGWNVD